MTRSLSARLSAIADALRSTDLRGVPFPAMLTTNGEYVNHNGEPLTIPPGRPVLLIRKRGLSIQHPKQERDE